MNPRLAGAAGILIAAMGLTLWGLGTAGHPVREHSAAGSPSPSPSASPGFTLPSLSSATWQLKFHPTFAGKKLNRKIWDTCYPWSDVSTGCTNFGNGEYEWYLSSQDRVHHGLLYLNARRIPTAGKASDGKPKEYACRSGIVTTFHHFRFKYGVVQIIARMPAVKGMWPALWLASANKHPKPEIDIVEHWVRPQFPTGVFLHALNGPRLFNFPPTEDLAKGWHTFTLVWTSSQLTWYIDGRVALSSHVARYIPRQRMYFIADLADSRAPSRGGCGGSMIIKSLKIWQHR